MEFNYDNFNIIIELSTNNDNFKLKIYDNNTDKLYQDIFDNTKLNYKVLHIYNLLIEFFSSQDDENDSLSGLIFLDIKNKIINEINTLILNIDYECRFYEIKQELIINEIIDESTEYQIDKITIKIDKLNSSLDSKIYALDNKIHGFESYYDEKIEDIENKFSQFTNNFYNMGLGISISSKNYIPLNTKLLGISCFEITWEDYINFNNNTDNFLKNYNLDGGYYKDHIYNCISNKYTFEYDPVNSKNNLFNINSKVYTENLIISYNKEKKYNHVYKAGSCDPYFKFKIFNIYNTKYRDIYKNNENTNIYIINNTLLESTNDNVEYLLDNIKYLQKLTHLCIDCMYIKEFIPKYLPNSIEYLYIIDIDQEILSDLDHLTNLQILHLKFGMGVKILINASIQIKELLKINSNLKVIIENYNELKHKDLELVSLATFI